MPAYDPRNPYPFPYDPTSATPFGTGGSNLAALVPGGENPYPGQPPPHETGRESNERFTSDDPSSPGTGINPPPTGTIAPPSTATTTGGPANLTAQEPGITSPPRPPNPSWQMPTAASAANASRRAPRLTLRNGQWILSEHDHERVVPADQVGNAQSYVDDYWNKYGRTGGFQPGVGAQSNEAYGPAWLAGANPATNRFPGGGYAYGGFNFARDQDVSKSAKDAFAYATVLGERAGAGNMWHTKQGAQQFAELYVKPYLEQQGYKVLGIRGDQINIVTREDEAAGNTAGSWFDFVVNADGANPNLAWQIQSGTGADPGWTPPPTTGTTSTTTPPPNSTATSAATASINPYAYERLVSPLSDLAPS